MGLERRQRHLQEHEQRDHMTWNAKPYPPLEQCRLTVDDTLIRAPLDSTAKDLLKLQIW